MIFNYDKTDRWSILEFSKKLLGKSLEEAVAPDVIDPKRGKGQLGQLVEVYFFGIDNNSRQEADFPEAWKDIREETRDRHATINENIRFFITNSLKRERRK